MAGGFWRYFRDRLAWAQISGPGPLSALVKGLAAHMDETRLDMLLLREQFTPETADKSFLESYGAGRGIVRTRFDTDDSWRERIINAFTWHKLGGKIAGVEQILAENGFSDAAIGPVSLIRGGSAVQAARLWAHFVVSLDLTSGGLDQDSLDGLLWLVNEYKPARSRLWALSLKKPMGQAMIRPTGCIRLGLRVRLYPRIRENNA